jgi:hypothetical protein
MTNRSQNNDQPHVLDGLLMYDGKRFRICSLMTESASSTI